MKQLYALEPVKADPDAASVCRVAIVQTKPKKGALGVNLAHLVKAFEQIAKDGKTDLVVLPEAALTGYFLEGAVYELALSASAMAAKLAGAWLEANGGWPVDIACGFYENDGGTYHNSAVYLTVGKRGHEILHVHRKMFLPTYGVFDEERFLSRGRKLSVFETRFGKVALLICEDVWHSIMPTIAAVKGARMLVVPSAAPGRGIEHEGELESIAVWRSLLSNAAAEHGVFIVYAGLAGFEGGKGMTGSSAVFDPRGKVMLEAPPLGECILRAPIDLRECDVARASLPLLGDLSSVLPDLLLDDELPLPKRRDDAAGR
ncbi:MAG: beta-ureidopropionase [Candidatus Eremiobacteraeota bacterium]|nr:beta-ureidopropionase [Candidatus Eremiobacteraeota bacterium]